eukprot:12257778-Ditylum_brightwellii.AAC.1
METSLNKVQPLEEDPQAFFLQTMHEGNGLEDCALSDAGGSTLKARCGNEAARAFGRQEVCQMHEEHNVTAKEEDCKCMRKFKQQFVENKTKEREIEHEKEMHKGRSKPEKLTEPGPNNGSKGE